MTLEKALLTNTATNERVVVMFNPEEYTLKQDVNYARAAVPGLSAPLVQFVAGNQQMLQMELLVDTYEEHKDGDRVLNRAGDDVRALTKKITDLMKIDGSLHAPPVALFTWGSLAFTCVVQSVSQKFTMFMPSGIPVRAKLDVSFAEFLNTELEAKEIKRETSDYSKLHVVIQGETLSAIAGRVYQDATLWRPIAIRNRIDDPRHLEVGSELLIPQLPYRDPETGEVVK
jgi:nucleoid-associated protein YgaU